jgi:hypothetical protein
LVDRHGQDYRRLPSLSSSSEDGGECVDSYAHEYSELAIWSFGGSAAGTRADRRSGKLRITAIGATSRAVAAVMPSDPAVGDQPVRR